MDGAVDAAATEERRVRRIHDGVDVEGGDVGDADFEPGRTDLGVKQRGRKRTHHPIVA